MILQREQYIQLGEQYNDTLTKNEGQKQFLIQIIAEYRKSINKYVPDGRKSTVLKGHETN